MKYILVEAGMKFGRWVVLIPSVEQTKGKAYLSKCKCQCGTVKLVRNGHLRDGQSRSCGCLRNETSSLPAGEAAKRSLYASYKHAARHRHYEWSLTREQFDDILYQNCHYCGLPPSLYKKSANGPTGIFYNGLDRLDNKQGYVPNNVRPCCETCNQGKHMMSENQFITWVERVYEYQKFGCHSKLTVIERPPSLGHLNSKRKAKEILEDNRQVMPLGRESEPR